jgi:hypothetical protein
VIERVEFGSFAFRHHLWNAVLSWFYGNSDFGASGTMLYGYDWRASLLDTAEDLANQLTARMNACVADIRPPESSSLVFLTHSMGGLVARIAVGNKLLHPSWINQIIHVGSPLDGSPAAFRTAFDHNGLPYLNYLIAVCRYKNRASYLRVLQECFQSFPSLYQLFPPHDIDFLYYGPRKPRANPFNEDVIDDEFKQYALDAHGSLRNANQIFNDNKTSINLIYTDSLSSRRTELEYAVEVVDAPRRRYIVRGAHAATDRGDGTVPSYSARESRGDVKKCPVIDIEHAYMCNHRDIAALLDGIIV